MQRNEDLSRVTPLTPPPLRTIAKSTKLADVCYDIRGPVLQEATRLEEEGHRVIKLNIGNPAPFGFEAPEEIVIDVIHHLRESQGYCDSKGLYSARKAIMQYCQQRPIPHVEIDDIYIGNGVSELIVMAMQALLNNGDEILVPSPDYPLWTAAITLCGGKAVHYRCDEQADWQPDLDDMKRKITSRTRGIVVINPNNPTGAVYSHALLTDIVEIARQKDLILFADEIYDKIIYDDAVHTPLASLAPDLLVLSFNGLSKTYRVAGFPHRLDGDLRRQASRHRLRRGAQHPRVDAACARTCRRSTRFKPRSAAIRASSSSFVPVDACISSACSRTRC